MRNIILVGILLLVSGCASELQGPMCTADAQCELPMEYALRSNCPYAAACVDGECGVVCFDYFHDPNPDINKSHPQMCQSDSECTCEHYLADDGKGCTCLNGKCAMVVQ